MNPIVVALLIVAALIFVPAGLLSLAALYATARHVRGVQRVPAGHVLGDARRVGSLPLPECFAADCGCGITVYGASLPSVWGRHEQHLSEVKAASMRSHPSGGAA